jgi:hypothetical protein
MNESEGYWQFLTCRSRRFAADPAISEAQFAELIDTCRHLDRVDRAADKLIALTIPT